MLESSFRIPITVPADAAGIADLAGRTDPAALVLWLLTNVAVAGAIRFGDG